MTQEHTTKPATPIGNKKVNLITVAWEPLFHMLLPYKNIGRGWKYTSLSTAEKGTNYYKHCTRKHWSEHKHPIGTYCSKANKQWQSVGCNNTKEKTWEVAKYIEGLGHPKMH